MDSDLLGKHQKEVWEVERLVQTLHIFQRIKQAEQTATASIALSQPQRNATHIYRRTSRSRETGDGWRVECEQHVAETEKEKKTTEREFSVFSCTLSTHRWSVSQKISTHTPTHTTSCLSVYVKYAPTASQIPRQAQLCARMSNILLHSIYLTSAAMWWNIQYESSAFCVFPTKILLQTVHDQMFFYVGLMFSNILFPLHPSFFFFFFWMCDLSPATFWCLILLQLRSVKQTAEFTVWGLHIKSKGKTRWW